MKALRANKVVTTLVKARDTAADEAAIFDKPALIKLEARFKELQSQAFRDLVEAAAELGAILEDAHKQVDRLFPRWLERIGVSRPSAYNYMAVAELARKNPNIIESGRSSVLRRSTSSPGCRWRRSARCSRPASATSSST